MSEKNKSALPSGAKEQISQNGALGRQVGVPTYFFRSFYRVDDVTQHITKSNKSDQNLASYAHFTISSA